MSIRSDVALSFHALFCYFVFLHFSLIEGSRCVNVFKRTMWLLKFFSAVFIYVLFHVFRLTRLHRDLKARNIVQQEKENAVTHCKSKEHPMHKLPLDPWSLCDMLCPQCEPHISMRSLGLGELTKELSASLYIIKSALSNWLGPCKPKVKTVILWVATSEAPPLKSKTSPSKESRKRKPLQVGRQQVQQVRELL